MKLTFNGSGPTKIEILIRPGDRLEANDELSRRIAATSPQWTTTEPATPAAAEETVDAAPPPKPKKRRT